METPRMIGTWVGGSAKFGWIPCGGSPAGSVLSKAGGMAWMTFGSKLRVNMVIPDY